MNFLKPLQKSEDFFYGTLGTWKTDPLDFKLKEDVRPIGPGTYPVPKVHEEIFKKEVERLVLLGVLELANDSEWGDPSFVQPELKLNLVHFLGDFHNRNKQLKQNHIQYQK